MMSTDVILVNPDDSIAGRMEKMEAHRKGILHRAFSIFIFNRNGEMLLQQRSSIKYHSAGLWTNACCSHPLPNEETKAAAHRRLKEELGFDTALEKVFDFVYLAEMENGLTEHEFDHVFTGEYEGEISPDNGEVQAWKYETIETIQEYMQTDPSRFTAWFLLAFPRIEEWWKRRYRRKD
jgi:isopentenyl-diphosphate delta-isomerase